MEDFIHLHTHTYFSILDGMSPIKKLVSKAVDNGMRGMAITDHGNMFGIKELFDECNKVNKGRKKEGLEPFKPIFGCEMYVARRSMEMQNQDKNHPEDRGGWHLIVLAKNLNGYKNLIKLVSDSWVDGFYGKPRTDHEHLEKYHEDLIVCSACIGGEVPKKILAGDIEGARKAIEWHKKVWGDDYYLELQRHEVKNPTQRANRETFPLQQQANAVLIELAKEYGIKLICSNDAHFVDEDDAEAHDHLLCIATSKVVDDPTRMLYSKQEWFKTKEEMNDLFSDVPEALANTCEILDKCEFYDLESDPIMPFFPIPEDFGTEEEWRKKYTEEDLFKEFTTDENGENQMPEEEGLKKIKKLGGYDKIYRIKFEADYLAKLAYEGAQRIYGSGTPDDLTADKLIKGSYNIPEEVEDRIRFELHIMKTMGFPGYFLIVSDFINSARKELDVWVGPGRGSAAGSVVAYCLGITKIDPLKYDLLFERFLNPDRISLPDIDTDFDDDGRGKVLQWVMDKYGHENCAHIITYGSMAAKNSIKDVARTENFALDKTNALCKAMPDRLPDGMKPKLENYIKCTPELQMAAASADAKEANTIKYARKLEGTVRNTGIHACGFIICRDPISSHVPVSTADDPDFPDIKTAVTQYDGHVIESTGLIKMDFLGLKTLSEQKECCKNVKLTRGIDIDLDHIPIDDPKTYELYQKGQTVGTFQFESAGMQKYLRELHPTVFEDLIAMNALYRPGPMDYIPSFIARKNGREPITYDIDCMEKYLKDTYGITVYQEQVMLLSRQLADFTRGQSDALRKAMGKKKKDIVDQMKPMFIEGGKKNGHDPKILEKIWADWEKFASYAFNKSHAACYSWVAYQTAYLKANYPEEFMAALLTRRRSDIKEVTKLLDECKALGIMVKGPSVNDSRQTFNVTKDGSIRFGFAAISGIGDNAADEIVREREDNGPYKDIYDFVKRINFSNVNSKCVENLANSGGFDCLGLPREQYFAPDPTRRGEPFFKTLIAFGQQYQQAKKESENDLFGGLFGGEESAVEISLPKLPPFEEMSHIEKLNIERSLIGLYLSAHPLDEFKPILKGYCNTSVTELEDIAELKKREEIRFGGIVTAIKRTGFTKRGNTPYGIVQIEDFEGTGELFLIADTWTNNVGILTVGSTIFVRGKMEARNRFNPDDIVFRPSEIRQLGQVQNERLTGVKISMNANDVDPLDAKELMEILSPKKEKDQASAEGKDIPKEKPHELVFEIKSSDSPRPINVQGGANTKILVDYKLIERINAIKSFECNAIWN
ncbi:MAG: DNA polymerase III subunit alpha [Bacteroidaceae bacterium]|nr:DNA polymerase III subunit alpha [Bacteroidaceae bacterium]